LFSNSGNVVQLRYIEPNASDRQGGLGVTYDWSASADRGTEPSLQPGSDFILSKLAYELAIKGSYAFNDADNNQNLSQIKAAARLERGDFGKLAPKGKAVGEAFQHCLEPISAGTADDAQRRENDREFYRCIAKHGISDIVDKAPGAYYYWMDFHGGLEANQNYSQRHTLFGLTGAYASEPSSAAQRFNVFDWPFALLRRAFSDDHRYVAPFPSLLGTVERLDAKDDEVRAALTDELTYTRAIGEVTFNTRVADTAVGPVRFNMSYRYYHELSAPGAIERANLDRFNYVSAMLLFPARLLPFARSDQYELFVRYTSGQLPFDSQADHAYEIGISTNIEWLGQLLQR
jgi:hypothetical protein